MNVQSIAKPTMAEQEQELKRLIAEAFPQKPKAQHRPTKAPKLTVELAVQHSWGGSRFKFQHTTTTISRFEAKLEAEKAARDKGYKVWWELDTYEGEARGEDQ